MRATYGRLVQVATCFEDQAPSLADLTDDELSAHRDELAAEFAGLNEIDNAELTDEQVDRIEALGALMTATRAESARRVAAAALVEDTPEVVEDEAPEALVAATPAPAPRPAPVAARPRQIVEAPEAPEDGRIPIYAAADVSGYAAGAPMSLEDISSAIVRRATSLPKLGARAGKFSNRYGVGLIRKEFAPQAIVSGNDAEEAIKFVTDERNTPKGSLVASGGWCAPSETLYDLCELETAEGLYSLPEIMAARGGFNSTIGPDFADLFSDTGFCFTEAQDIAGDYDPESPGNQGKPCFKVECPEFTEMRLDVCGVCISAGYLQNRAYPELTARTVRGALVAHQHRLASRILADVIADSDAITIPAPSQGDGGATAPLLDAIELQVWDMRYRNRLSPNRTLEAVFPLWVKGLVRADLSRRLGVDLISVNDARINAWFAERGISAQFIYNFDDLGGIAAAVQWPSEVRFVLYVAGTWVRASSDVIDLGVVHDSSQFAFNNYTALFSEEGWGVLKRCHDSRIISVPVCASGATAAGVNLCDVESL